jgi:glycosyltransferase involved in cell wall biosynthesis
VNVQPPAPVLFALPCGLSLGGVTTWAVRLANMLAASGRTVGMILHRPRVGDSAGSYPLDDRVLRFDLSHLPPMDEALGGAHVYAPSYRQALATLGAPAVALPSLMGDCYGVFADLMRTSAAAVRIVGWAHLDSPYEIRVLERYAPIISRFVGVSATLTTKLHQRLPTRASHVEQIAYGVPIPERRITRPSSRELRIAYVGRLDEPIKRVSVLPLLCRELRRRSIPPPLHVAGNGPAAGALRASARLEPSLRMLGTLDPASVDSLLACSDLLVLPSRAEGLPLVLQEAMARGCVPVACEAASGVGQLITDGITGVLARDAESSAELAANLAFAIARAQSRGLAVLAESAQNLMAQEYNLDSCHARMIDVLDLAASDPPRAWTLEQSPYFTAAGSGGSGSVPSDGADRLRRTLASLAGKRIAIYGAGRHTVELMPIVREHDREVVAFIDDDPARLQGQLEHKPVVSPQEALASGASEVVISSWLHEEAMWARRDIFERAGLRVHRLYAD